MYYITVFLGLTYEWAHRFYHNVPKTLPTIKNDKVAKMFVPAIATLILLSLLRLTLVYHAAIHEHAPYWLSRLPIIPLYDSLSLRYTTYRQSIALGLALVSIMESIALFILYKAIEKRAPQRVGMLIIAGACVIMTALAVAAPALSATDLYFYSAYGKMSFQAYGSEQLTLPCPTPQAEVGCMQPALPNVYGPLYTVYLQTLLQHIKPLLFRIEVLRITNMLWVFLFFSFLRSLKIAPSIIVIAALNPMIFTQYIAEGHNDIIAVDLIMAGILLAQRMPFMTLFLVISAALVKLPFAFFGIFAFQRFPIFQRTLWAASAIVLSITLSLLWGGKPYIDSLLYYSRFHQFSWTFEHRAIALTALIVIAAGFFRNRFGIGGAYTLPALGGGSPFPWYSFWAIPYLLQANRSKLAFFFITLPMTSFLMETPFQIPALWCAVILILTTLTIRRILRRGMPTLERESP